MTRITTHVVNLAAGQPAAGVPVVLERDAAATGEWCELGRATTDADGRIAFPVEAGPGRHRLTFAIEPLSSFYPEVSITFNVAAGQTHYHVPLLLSPYGYSTYRGS